MSAEEDLAPELKSFEAALASLVPRADQLQRDRLMFAAGAVSVRRGRPEAASRVRRVAWPAASAAMTAVAAVLAVMLVVRPGPQLVERVVYVPAAEPGKSPPRDPGPEKVQTAPAPEAGVPGPEPSERRPAPRRSLGVFGSSLAVAEPAGSWWALRRSGLDLEALDRALASRQAARPPGGSSDVERESDAHPASYRRLLDELLDD